MPEPHIASCSCVPCKVRVMVEARERIPSFVDIHPIRRKAMHLLLTNAIHSTCGWVSYEVDAARKLMAGEFPGGPDATS